MQNYKRKPNFLFSIDSTRGLISRLSQKRGYPNGYPLFWSQRQPQEMPHKRAVERRQLLPLKIDKAIDCPSKRLKCLQKYDIITKERR